MNTEVLSPLVRQLSLSRAFQGRQPQRQSAQKRAQCTKTRQDRTRERDLVDGSSENYLGGEPLALFVDLVWIPSICSTIGDVDKSNENHFDNLEFNI